MGERPTPREAGFSMPAEWEPHQACYMEWPTLTRKELWADRFDEAKHDYAAVANAVAAFEPVVMVCDPEQEAEARRSCGGAVEILPLPIDDSWMRDNGPIFVRDAAGRVALVHFRFNSWGERFRPMRRTRRYRAATAIREDFATQKAEHKAKRSKVEADLAADDAASAIHFAFAAVEEAEYAVLEATLA